MNDFDAIQARVKAASPLPWVTVPRSCKDHGDYYDLHGGPASDDPAVWWLNEIATHQDGDEGVPLDTADAEFIVHAREDIPALFAEIARLNGELTEAREKVRICEQQTARIDREQQRLGEEQLKQIDRDLCGVIDERDSREALLDRFAAAVAPEEVIGEHSSGNCPWENALDLITPAAEVDALRQENQRLRKENDDLTVGCGIPGDLDDDALDDLLRTTDDTVLRQLNDVLDVEPALSAALTRREA